MEQGREHEALRAQPPADHVEHPHRSHEEPGQPEVARPLLEERGKLERRGHIVRDAHDDDRLEGEQPAEDLYRPGRAALVLALPQPPEHGRPRSHLRIFLTAPTASSTGLALGAAAWASFKRTSEIWPATISTWRTSATKRGWVTRSR